MTQSILVIDAGTTSTRAMLFSHTGQCLGSAQQPITQYYPQPGWVEHDAAQIWATTLACVQAMVREAGGPGQIAAIGITNQRETVVFWDRRTGAPLAPAIVWQDRRTADACASLQAAGHEPAVQAATGLLLDPYFSATKISWGLAHWPQLTAAGPHLAVGTVESYLLFRLTGGAHLTDASNAARTSLMTLATGTWDSGLCNLFGVPKAALPDIVDCAGPLGATDPALFGQAIPVTGMAGDQQAATIGQACLAPGQTKATFGTGAFVLTCTGTAVPASRHRLLATVLVQLGGMRQYALEGSVFVAGSLMQWLRDSLGLIGDVAHSAELAASVADNAGVVLVPALSGLGAPHWRPHARASLSGLSFATSRAHIVRAALEAMAHQVHDLKTAFAADGSPWADVRMDGGMATNDWMAQDLADILALPVERPAFVETTALGAAMLAAVGAGLYPSLAAASVMRGDVEHFTPQMDATTRQQRLAGWAAALKAVLDQAQPPA